MSQSDLDAAWELFQKTLSFPVRSYDEDKDVAVELEVFSCKGSATTKRDPAQEGKCPKHADLPDDRACAACGKKACSAHPEAKDEADRYCHACGQEVPQQVWVPRDQADFLDDLFKRVADRFKGKLGTLVVKDKPVFKAQGVVWVTAGVAD